MKENTQAEPNPLETVATGDLIKSSLAIRDFIEEQTQRFSEFCKPHEERQEAIKAELHRRMIEQKVKTFKADGIGTAFQQARDSLKIEDTTKFLDWCLDNWDEWGGRMLQLRPPQVDAVRSYMDGNNGALPPEIKKSTVIQIHIRKGKE